MAQYPGPGGGHGGAHPPYRVPGGIVGLSLPLILRFYNLEAETLQLAVLLIVMHNLFELLGLDTMIVNAARMKAVPGRKTDSKDAEWIAEQLQYGLLRASFVPSRGQRELRELTRCRKGTIEERSRELNRLQKVLGSGITARHARGIRRWSPCWCSAPRRRAALLRPDGDGFS